MTRICKVCGESKGPEGFSPSYWKTGTKICRICTNERRMMRRRGETPTPLPKGRPRTLPEDRQILCPRCVTTKDGTHFPAWVEGQRTPWCMACRAEYMRLRGRGIKPPPTPKRRFECVECGKEIWSVRNRKYCSPVCNTKHNRTLTPDKRKAWDYNYQLRAKYGIDAKDVSDMLDAQGGGCAICGELPLRPAVDHDHATGKIRGILCLHHNSGMGLLGDDPKLLRAAADYLERTSRSEGQLVLPS